MAEAESSNVPQEIGAEETAAEAEAAEGHDEHEAGESRRGCLVIPIVVVLAVVLSIVAVLADRNAETADNGAPVEEPAATEEPEAPGAAEGGEFAFDFEDGEQGWAAGFADLPTDFDPDIYELEAEWRPLPDELEGHGYYIQGHNRSDDLFMFLKTQVGGLAPETTYNATFYIDLASSIPAGLMGIGGSPGESVFVKAGATTGEPEVVEESDGWLRMTIDKGNQASEGEDMINLGDIAVEDLTEEEAGQFKIKPLSSEGRDFTVTSDSEGNVWLIVGTDSGFEGLTQVYYDRIRVVLTP